VEPASGPEPTVVPFPAILFDAMDVCGIWPSLVGGGTGAGF
jgi:hypothetical protein